MTVSGVGVGLLENPPVQPNAVADAAMFEPPEGKQRREVDQLDLYRMFAAMLDFAAERLEGGPPAANPRDHGDFGYRPRSRRARFVCAAARARRF